MIIKYADFSGWSVSELINASKILREIADGRLPQPMQPGCLMLGFNTSSGYVFVTDEDLNCAILVDDELSLFVTCPECGNEGTLDDFDAAEICCQTYMESFS